MEEVTDFAFREMFARYSNPAHNPQPATHNSFVMFTEFINVDGLTHPEGRKKLEIDLKFSQAQRPMVAQIWGNNPAKFEEAAKIIADMGYDGIDINMGCPQSKEIGIGACAALIRNPTLAQEIIAATKKGGESAGRRMPVSVKTRLGYTNTDEMAGWAKSLLAMDIANLSMHARTKQEMSKVPAHWDKIKELVRIRDEMRVPTTIVGNGDIKSREEGLARAAETGCDGVMIARGTFGHPWFFRTDGFEPDVKERLRVMLEHAELFDQTLGKVKSFAIMRKHFKAYCSGFPGSHELRAKLMAAKDLAETKKIVGEYTESLRIA